MNRHILITGGAGYIGSHIAALLIESGYHISVIDNLSTGDKRNKLENAEYFDIDLCDTDQLSQVFESQKFSTVIHLAAKTSVEESHHTPALYYEQNTTNTLNIAKICQKNNVKNIIFSSTAAVYGDSESKMITETSNASPISPYGQSKYFAELMLSEVCRTRNTNCIILRYFNVAGQHGNLGIGSFHPNPSALIQKFSIDIILKKKLVIHGNKHQTEDGTCVRDFIHVNDIAQAHRDIIRFLEKRNDTIIDTFNIGYGVGTSVLEIANRFKCLICPDIIYEIASQRIGDIAYSVANSSKIKQLIGWKSAYSRPIDSIIRSEYEWRQNLLSNLTTHS